MIGVLSIMRRSDPTVRLPTPDLRHPTRGSSLPTCCQDVGGRHG
jgi:hypothetical protein